MILYISGAVDEDPDYRAKFLEYEVRYRKAGHTVLSPARHPDGLGLAAYMRLAFADIDRCDALVLLPDWTRSAGAAIEEAYARYIGKEVLYG